MINTIKTINCDVCGELFGTVPGRDESKRLLREKKWRFVISYDVCENCIRDLDIVGAPSSKALHAIEARLGVTV